MDLDPRRIKVNKKNVGVVKKVKGNSVVSTNDEKQRVHQLQQEINAKEQELSRVKGFLARNDTVDINEGQTELNHLQSAFDIVKKKCEAKLKPFLQKYNKTESQYQGLLQAIETYSQSAKERDNAVTKMQNKITDITTDLETYEVTRYDEVPIFQTVKTVSQIQTGIDQNTLAQQMSALKDKTINHMNISLEKQYNDAKEREERAKRRTQVALQDSQAVLQEPPQVIDREWVLAKHKMDKLKIIIEDAKRSLAYLKETAEKINAGNRLTMEELEKTNAELVQIGKFLPDAPHEDGPKKGEGVSRGDLTVIEAERDVYDVLISVQKTKAKVTKTTLEKLRAKLEEMPAVLEENAEDLEQTKIERQNAEEALRRSNEQKADLLARIKFHTEERDLLLTRIKEQEELLAKIHSETEEENAKIKKQETIKKVNAELEKLKGMDFDRYTSTIQNLMQYQGSM